ncbi:MAG: response regulator [Anaerolineaceae bacterium]|nr:response regulator [Anaerolineaceae bacterium]
MKKIWILLINIILILGIFFYVFTYSRNERKKVLTNRIHTFENMTIAMEQVAANYLDTEQGICDAWARYINSEDMTIDQAIAFVGASQKPEIMVQILFIDEPEVRGLSTVGKVNDPDNRTVKFLHFDLIKNYTALTPPGNHINITRSYTNPINGVQSIAFCNQVMVRENEEGPKRPALLMRILSLKTFERKWVFPSEDFQKAEIALIDSSGNYIIKGQTFKSTNFFEFYKSYNQTDYLSINEFQDRIRTETDHFFMFNSRGEECLTAHTPITMSDGWALISMIPLSEIDQGSIDLLLIFIVAAGLLLLLIIDTVLLMRLNRQLTIAANAAETANRAKTDFLSTMSHDIRTPMNAIIGLTTIAEKNVNDPESVKENLRKISMASNHLLTLINDILDISKVESGKLTLSPVSFSIAESAENLVNISQPMVKEKNIDFNFRISPIEYEYLYADELRLNQIFINILSNAIKYTNPGGRVTIDMSETKSGQPGKVHLTYRVEDTGIGMSPEYMKKMYEPFSRQTDSRVNTIQGTGLGLAITKKMVDLMGGTIDCQSEQNKGTCFAIELDIPIAERQLDEMKLEPIDVLVVDDDEVLLETAGDTLRTLGARAETSSSGADALRKISQRHELGKDYDVVIIDWKMPEMDGLELTRRIRQIAGDNLPILLISAYDWSDIEESARDAGANGFVSKPLFRSTLYEKITEVLGIETEMTAPDEDNSDLAGMHVLVAEDNDVNWEIIFMLLEMYGIESERAVNGQIAVEMAEANPDKYDLIFMDIQMPVMNGLDATKMIRASKNEKCAQLPIIAMTADAFSENVAECLAVGMNGHIAKPVDIKIVLKEIRKIKESKK